MHRKPKQRLKRLPRCYFCKKYLSSGLFRVNETTGKRSVAHTKCVGVARKQGRATNTPFQNGRYWSGQPLLLEGNGPSVFAQAEAILKKTTRERNTWA